MSNFMNAHGWPIIIWGTIEKSGKKDFSGRVSYWALIVRHYQKHDGSQGSQYMFVTGGDRSGLDKAEPGKVIICSAVYGEGKDREGVWRPRPWVASSTVLPVDVQQTGQSSNFPPVPSHHQNGHSVMHYQQPPYSTPTPAHMSPASAPAPGQQPGGIYHDHEIQF